MLKNALFAGCISIEPVQINYWEIERNRSDFGDLDLIFKVTKKSKNVEKCLVFVISIDGID